MSDQTTRIEQELAQAQAWGQKTYAAAEASAHLRANWQALWLGLKEARATGRAIRDELRPVFDAVHAQQRTLAMAHARQLCEQTKAAYQARP